MVHEVIPIRDDNLFGKLLKLGADISVMKEGMPEMIWKTECI